jgi:hypothetical protein
MSDRALSNGLLLLGVGLLACSLSTFLERLRVLGGATEFARGLFDGLSVVAFAVAICVLVRGGQAG